MRVIVNGEERVLEVGLTVAQLVAAQGLGAGPVAIELNLEVLPRAEHGTRILVEGDVLEIVHFVGGG